MDYEGNCRHPHGHNARVEVKLSAPKLDRRGMVVDFNDLRSSLRGWIDQTLDHRMILRRGDPLIEPLRALGEPFFVMEENPTAENLARLLFERAREVGLPVVRVRLWETDDNFADYAGG
ncbi:MAG: 6-carboxytetrahydropterin synthase [Planctomycetes bacterium]|nr:6-carboxytetrahydropterin synthase [Planctomycetota bacterium]